MSTSNFLKNQFFVNKNYITFSYQSERRIKIAIYDVNRKALYLLSSKNSDDPFVSLSYNLVYLDSSNNLTFAISSEDILNLKQKQPLLYNKIPKEIKDHIKDADSLSNFYLFTAHLKNQ